MSANTSVRPFGAPSRPPDRVPAQLTGRAAVNQLQSLARLEPGVWRELVDDNYDRVLRYAYLRTGDAALARRATDDAFRDAVRVIQRSGARSPVALLLELASRALESRDGRGRSERGVPPEMRVLSETLSHARADVRNVMLLRLVEGRSIHETAAMLDISPGDVRAAQRRAVRDLSARRPRYA